MATKKDLVEAYAFSRRRLVTAFVSGAPGGREVEPSRPGRTIVGGAALAVLLVAGAAVAGIFTNPRQVDFTQAGLISDESGADYVILPDEDGEEPVLRPVANITSALLLLGEAASSPVSVSNDDIVGIRDGDAIGILLAPQTPPDADSFVATGWTACTTAADGREQGIQVQVSSQSQVEPIPDAGFVVQRGQALYLIAESEPGRFDRVGGGPRAYSYRIPGALASAMTVAVAQTTSDNIRPVSAEWLDLFPEGGRLSLASFGVTGTGIWSANPSAEIPPTARVGDLVRSETGDRYVLTTTDGQPSVLLLDDFSAEIYAIAATDAATIDIAGRPSEPTATTAAYAAANWPTRRLSPHTEEQLCAVLDAGADRDPGTRLATAPSGSAAALDAALVGPDQREIDVESGRGAFVLAGGWSRQGPTAQVLLDDRGEAYPVEGAQARANLGYGDVDDVVVPDTWIELFGEGVTLSIDAARCPPVSDPAVSPAPGTCA